MGLDRGILAIQEPLGEFYREVEVVSTEVAAGLEEVRRGLAEQSRLREERALVASLRQTRLALAKVERVVGGEVKLDSAERLAQEINQLQFSVEKLGGCPLVRESYGPRLARVCDTLHDWLDGALLQEVQGPGVCLARVCRVYSSIGRVQGAERAVRLEVVRWEG